MQRWAYISYVRRSGSAFMPAPRYVRINGLVFPLFT